MRQLCYTSATQLVSDNCTEELWGNESIVGEIFCYTLLGQCYNYYYFFYFQFYTTGSLECYLGCQEWRRRNLCFLRGLYYAVFCWHFGRPSVQQVYESSFRTMIQFLKHSKQGGGWGMGGTFQAFLWIMNLPYATHTALLGNLFDCSIRLEFRLHCYLSLQLFLDCLQQQLEVSKNNYILFILCLEMSSQDVSWGFTLERSILIRIPRMFLFCFANLIFILGYCSTGCFKGNT